MPHYGFTEKVTVTVVLENIRTSQECWYTFGGPAQGQPRLYNETLSQKSGTVEKERQKLTITFHDDQSPNCLMLSHSPYRSQCSAYRTGPEEEWYPAAHAGVLPHFHPFHHRSALHHEAA